MQFHIGQRVVIDYGPDEILSGTVSTLPGEKDRDGCHVSDTRVGVDLDQDYGVIDRHAWIFSQTKVRPADEAPEPTPAEPVVVTDEQRAAWQRLQSGKQFADDRYAADLAVVAPLLPSELKDPQPELPTEPGVYLDKNGDVWRVWEDRGDGMDMLTAVTANGHPNPGMFAPFTRLVPERPQVTHDEIDAAWGSAREDRSITRHSDGSMTAVGAFHAGFRATLVNGDPR